VQVAELSGDLDEMMGDAFTLSGGSVKIRYDVKSSEASGTALIYLLKDGATKAQDENGDIKVASYDVMAIGNKSGKAIVKKDAGKYYLDINTSAAVDSYPVTIFEKK
jgi:hypothetical protein